MAAAIARVCEPGDVLLLAGDLGSGKTTFAQGFGRGLGVTEPITSPTFALVRQYPIGDGGGDDVRAGASLRTLLHADVYRLDRLAEIADLGLGELVEDGVGRPGGVGRRGRAGARPRVAVPPPRRPARGSRRSSDGDHSLVRPEVGRSLGTPVRGRHPVGGDRVNLLAIESATSLVGAALLADSGAAAERSHQEGRMHAESLAPAIEEVCALSGITVREVEAIAVDVGPGLFTGLRVGVATAKALAQGLGIGVLAVSSLDILAAGADAASGTDGARTVVAVVDARRGEVFTSRYRFDGAASGADGVLDPAPAQRSPPRLVTPEALTRSLTDMDRGGGERVLIVGDGAVRYRHLLADAQAGDLDLVERVSSPSPLTLARLARLRLDAGAGLARPADVVPDYRREADARINWEQRIPPTGTPGRVREP